jgi:hypothetical protein
VLTGGRDAPCRDALQHVSTKRHLARFCQLSFLRIFKTLRFEKSIFLRLGIKGEKGKLESIIINPKNSKKNEKSF